MVNLTENELYYKPLLRCFHIASTMPLVPDYGIISKSKDKLEKRAVIEDLTKFC
jgi:hypothetical protein